MQPEKFVKFVKCASEHYIFLFRYFVFIYIFLLGKYAPPPNPRGIIYFLETSHKISPIKPGATSTISAWKYLYKLELAPTWGEGGRWAEATGMLFFLFFFSPSCKNTTAEGAESLLFIPPSCHGNYRQAWSCDWRTPLASCSHLPQSWRCRGVAEME